jgi:hypothetical protein
MLSQEKVLNLSTSLRLKGTLPLNDAIELITDYCLIHNKESEKINMLISACSFNQFLLMSLIDTALDYYEHYYRFTFLLDRNNSIIKIYTNENT